MHSQMIQSLLEERKGYVARNLPDRVASVDASLRELGFEHKYLTQETATAVPQTERAAKPVVQKRKK
jgi:hypothetical protein